MQLKKEGCRSVGADLSLILVFTVCICFKYTLFARQGWFEIGDVCLQNTGHCCCFLFSFLLFFSLYYLWAHLVGDTLMIFPYFPQKIGFDISCILSPLETVCMKCQSLGKIRKIFSLLKFLPKILSISDLI